MCLAIPAQVIKILPQQMARVNLSGVHKDISLSLLEDVAVGDFVIVHVGFALQKLDEDEAQKSLQLFAELAQSPQNSGAL